MIGIVNLYEIFVKLR